METVPVYVEALPEREVYYIQREQRLSYLQRRRKSYLQCQREKRQRRSHLQLQREC
jgi:hypothetical protein